MSSILKALQKVEQERAARRGGPPDISGEIVKRDKSGKAAPPWLLPGGMAVVAAVAVLATYAIMGGFSGMKSVTRSDSPLPPPRTVQARPATDAGTAGTTATAPSLPPVEVIRDVPVARRTATRQASLPPKPAPRSAVPTPVAPQHATATPVKQEPPPQAPAKPSRPSLTVGGIAWQQSNSLRLAVVNGMSVSEGAVVEGARVEEIFPDRILFSFRNEQFEVPLEK